MMGWCSAGQHDKCKRQYERYYFNQVKNKSVLVMTGEIVVCQCIKRGCPCHVPARLRLKAPAKRKRKS